MAQTVVDCCGSALQKLGAARILSITDNTPEARQCNRAFDSNRRSELRKHNWNFAIKRAILAPEVETPAFDFTYQFTLPTDCLKVLLPADATLDWVVEGRKVLTNASNVMNLRYVSDVTDLTQWDPAAYDMLAISMAIDMCEALTNSTGKKATLDQEYRDARAEARRINAFEQLPAEGPTDSWLLARL